MFPEGYIYRDYNKTFDMSMFRAALLENLGNFIH